MRTAILTCIVAPSVAIAPAFAQSSEPATSFPRSASFVDVGEAHRAEAEEAIERVDVQTARAAAAARRSSDGDARGGVVDSGFQLRTGSEDSNVSLTLSTAHDTIGSFGKVDFALTLTAPLDKQSKEGALITRDGLPGGWSAGISFSSINGSYRPLTNRSTQIRLLRLLMDRCEEKARRDGARNAGEIDAKCPKNASPEDWGGDYLTKSEWSLYRGEDGADDRGFIPQRLTFWNLSGALNVDDFEFADPTTFAEDKKRRLGYAFSGSFGFSPASAKTFLLGSVEYRRTWKASDKKTRCPIASAAPVDCLNAVFAPPEKNIDYKLSALARFAEPFGSKLPIAMDVKGSYDAKDNVFGVEVPVYTFLDDGGKLRGGVRFGWDSDKKRVAVGVFIGAPFALFQ